jgi:hypothetical protein
MFALLDRTYRAKYAREVWIGSRSYGLAQHSTLGRRRRLPGRGTVRDELPQPFEVERLGYCLVAIAQFVEDLERGRFRKGLRVKGVKGADGVFEMTWADDGRATFEYGPPVVGDEPHVAWRRVGAHAIFREP